MRPDSLSLLLFFLFFRDEKGHSRPWNPGESEKTGTYIMSTTAVADTSCILTTAIDQLRALHEQSTRAAEQSSSDKRKLEDAEAENASLCDRLTRKTQRVDLLNAETAKRVECAEDAAYRAVLSVAGAAPQDVVLIDWRWKTSDGASESMWSIGRVLEKHDKDSGLFGVHVACAIKMHTGDLIEDTVPPRLAFVLYPETALNSMRLVFAAENMRKLALNAKGADGEESNRQFFERALRQTSDMLQHRFQNCTNVNIMGLSAQITLPE